jgi:hypothetical protein
MPILTLQRSLREIGRIRLGEKVAAGNGRSRPSKLEVFRFTSSEKDAIEAAAALYGGTPRRWDDAPIGEQWEVVTTSKQIPVIIPPGPAVLSQWYETWSGGGCTRRCDGVRELLTDSSCICESEEQRTCKATTRLNVILADLPGIGSWRLESHGYYAATELAGTVDLCQAAAGRGQLLPAVLGLQPRQVKRIIDGRPQTFNFVVPTLDVKVTPAAISSGSWSPVAAIGEPEPQAITAGEMQAAIAAPAREPSPKRSNAAPDIPATGIKPRPRSIQEVEVNEVRAAAVANGGDPNLAMLEVRHGTKAKALTEARRLAKDKGIDPPTKFEEISTELAQELLQ